MGGGGRRLLVTTLALVACLGALARSVDRWAWDTAAGVYRRLGGRPEVPTLLSLDPGRLDGSADLCAWD